MRVFLPYTLTTDVGGNIGRLVWAKLSHDFKFKFNMFQVDSESNFNPLAVKCHFYVYIMSVGGREQYMNLLHEESYIVHKINVIDYMIKIASKPVI